MVSVEEAASLVAAVRARDASAVARLLAERPGLVHARVPASAGAGGPGMGLLQLALYLRAGEVADALLAAGAVPSFFEAAILGDVDRLRRLAREDPALLRAQGPDGAPALHLAAHFGRLDALRLLLELGTPVDLAAGGTFGNGALHAAAAGAQAEAGVLLLEAGAQADARDRNGFTPLHLAAANGVVPLVRALLARGASPAAAGPDGRTPLSLAVERGRHEAAEVLRAHGG